MIGPTPFATHNYFWAYCAPEKHALFPDQLRDARNLDAPGFSRLMTLMILGDESHQARESDWGAPTHG